MEIRRDGLIAREELKHALDNHCDSFDHVGTGIGHFVYDGWIHSHPIGHRADSSRDQSRSGTKSLGPFRLQKGRTYAQSDNARWDCSCPSGDRSLCLPGHHLTSREKIIDIGPIQATADTKKTIPLSPLLGGLALVGGIVLVVVGAKKT